MRDLNGQQKHWIIFIRTKIGRSRLEILHEVEAENQKTGKSFDVCLVDYVQRVRHLQTQDGPATVRWLGS